MTLPARRIADTCAGEDTTLLDSRHFLIQRGSLGQVSFAGLQGPSPLQRADGRTAAGPADLIQMPTDFRDVLPPLPEG